MEGSPHIVLTAHTPGQQTIHVDVRSMVSYFHLAPPHRPTGTGSRLVA